jgi:hypothetical protein
MIQAVARQEVTVALVSPKWDAVRNIAGEMFLLLFYNY